MPSVLAEEVTVKAVPDTVKFVAEPSTPYQKRGLTIVDTTGSQSVAPVWIVVELMCPVSRGLLV